MIQIICLFTILIANQNLQKYISLTNPMLILAFFLRNSCLLHTNNLPVNVSFFILNCFNKKKFKWKGD